jgi:hypothetical protein
VNARIYNKIIDIPDERVRAEGRSVKEQARASLGALAAPSPLPLSFVHLGEPMGKPRMTQADRWKKRPCVMRYWLWCDRLRQACGIAEPLHLDTPVSLSVQAFFTMPVSWPAKKRASMAGMPHTSKPDGSNVLKGIEDALIANDQYVYALSLTKCLDDGRGPRVEVSIIGGRSWRGLKPIHSEGGPHEHLGRG